MAISDATKDLVLQALEQPKDAIFPFLSRALAQAFPKKAILETAYGSFDVTQFGREGQCERRDRAEFHQQWDTGWDGYHEQITSNPFNVWHSVSWQGNEIEVLEVGIYGAHCRETRHFILADSPDVAERFLEAVCRWNEEVRGEILIFEDGYWSKSSDLYESVRRTTLDSLVLSGDLREEILQDFVQFFESKPTYARYGIPWKRGVLFLGPPGNGKTHAIKGLVNAIGRPCLYVRSFKAEYQTPHHNISTAFRRARESAPCLFVLEDLDSLIDDENRSFFLNELDGFYANEGILTIATSNHPERLDPAILDRPSRFDRKYAFDLPGIYERKRYLEAFSARLEPELRLSADGVEGVAGSTDGFSFAYLKELFLSSMIKWIAAPGAIGMDQVMVSQSSSLREQMKTASDLGDAFPDGDLESMEEMVPAHLRSMYRRYMQFRGVRRR